MAPEGSRGRALRWILPGLLIVAFVVQCLATARTSSLANDEAKHLVTGWWLLTHGECCFGIDNSPLSAWFALPLALCAEPAEVSIERSPNAHRAGRAMLFGLPDPGRALLAARGMAILAGVVLLLAAYHLANRIFGPHAGLVPLTILAFEPNLVAQFSFLSTDALLTTTAVLFLLAEDRLLLRPSYRSAALCGVALGLAFVSKFTALVLVPVQLPLLLLYRRRFRARSLRIWAACAALAAVFAVLTVWIGYGGRLSPRFPFLAFPGLADGYLQAQALARKGLPAFFLGEVGRSWPTYFLACLALKTPIPELLAWLLGLAACLRIRPAKPDARRWAPALLAAAFLGVALASRLNIGARHILPVYAFMGIASGALAHASLPSIGLRGTRIVTAALLVGIAFEAIRIAPFSLSYFNQIAGGPRGGVRYLGDSNLDWGQDLATLKRVMEEQGIDEVILAYLGNTDPAFYGIEYQYLPRMFVGSTQGDRVVDPRREVLAVSTNNLQGFLTHKVDFSWLRGREPFTSAGYSIYLYDITGDAEAHEKLADIYRSTGFPGLARKEFQKAQRLRGGGVPDPS